MAIFASIARYIFGTFTSKATFIISCYVAHQRLFSDTKIDGHFALKSVSGSAANGLAFPTFGQNCSKIYTATHHTYIVSDKKCSPGNVVSGGIRFMQIFVGVRWRGGVK